MDPFPDDDPLPLPIELQDQSVPLASLAAGSLIGDVLAWNGVSWVSATPGVPINGVSGPLTGSTTNALSRWSNTDGNRLSNSTITLSDAGIFSTLKSASDVNSSDDFKINNLTVLSAENTNTFAGLTVAYNITSGINNVGFGLESLKMLSTGSRNVSLGSTNLTNLTTGTNNVSLGSGTAFDLTTGSNNIILGMGATAGNSNAQNRIVLGNGSGVYNNGFHIPVSTKFYFPLLESTAPLANVLYYDDTTGTIAQGTLTPQSDEFLDSVFRINDFNDPSAQLAFDCSDISSSTTRTIKIPNANMLLPVYSVSSISTGNLSAVLGNQNAYYGIDVSASSGNQNTAIGYQSAKSNLTGSSNLTLGYQSGYSTTGSNTLSIGNRAAYSNTTGQYNTVVGHQANYTNSTGNASSIYGYQAGYTNQSSNVSAFGYQSLYSLTSGDENSAFGYQTLFNNTIGSYNTVFGYNSGKTNISGAGLTAFGARSLETSTGNDNSAFGRNSLLILSTGINNTAFGSHAGISLIEGSNNTLLGYNADTATDSTSGSIVIGPEAVGKTNNTSSNGNNILTIKTPVANQGAYTNTIRNLPGPYILNYNAATEEITYVEGGGGGSTFLDDVFRVLNVDNLTKKFAVDCQYITPSTTRTFTVPDFDGIFPGLDAQNNLILGSIDSNITSGTNNTIIGKNAGASITTGANNVLVGYSVNTTYNNSILIGSSGTANNQIRIGFNGTSSLQTNTYIDGIYNNYTAGYIVVASSAGLLGSSNLLTINNEITANSVFEATVGAQVGYATGTAPPENGLLVAGAVGIGTETPLGILNIAGVITDVQTISSFANSQAGLIINNTFEPTISTNLLAGQYIQSTFISPDTFTADSIAGLYVSNIYDANVGIITNAYGILADSGSTGVGTILNAYSGYFKSPLAGSSRVALYADSLLVGYNTTTTSGSTTTLTNASMTQQFFTGTSTQTVVLPVVSTLFLGYQFVINNRSTQSITVQSSGLNTIIVMPANTTLVATCVLTTGTSASSWDVIYNGATSSPVTSITGTANQVLVNGTTGIPQTSDITLTLPQPINTTSSPTFAGLTTTGTTLLNSATAVGGSDPVQVVGNLSLGATASSTTGVLRFISGGSFNAIQSGLTASGGSAATLYFTDYGQNNIWMRLTSTGRLTIGSATATDMFNVGTAAQFRVTSLGVVSAGSWNGSVIGLQYGGTNNNLSSVITGAMVFCNGSALAYTAAGSSGQILVSQGTSTPIWSTTTFPATAGTAGTILRSNGTNIVNSTSTFSDTYTASSILYSNGANTVVGLATANNGVLITSGAGVPSISSTLPSAVQTNITQVGTITTGVWNATVIGLAYGGTNANITVITGAVAFCNATGLALTAVGTAGQLLQSAATGTPVWTSTLNSTIQTNITQLGTITSGTWNASIISGTYGGTGVNNSTRTITVSAGSAGRVLASDASGNAAYSTNTYPTTAGTTGTILRSNGTNIVNSTSTFSDTYTASSILYSNGANTVVGLATANNGVLITSGTGVPSISSTLPTTVQTNITQVGTITTGVWNATVLSLVYGGTNVDNSAAATGGIAYKAATTIAITAAGSAGQLLRSNGASAPTFTTATYPSTAGTTSTVLRSDGTNWVNSSGMTVDSVGAINTTSTISAGGSLFSGSNLSSTATGAYNAYFAGTQTTTSGGLQYTIAAASTLNPTAGGSNVYAHAVIPNITSVIATVITNTGGIYINPVVSSNAGTINRFSGIFVDATAATGAGAINSSYGGYFTTPLAGTSRVALYADTFFAGYDTTATAGTTTTLTNVSKTNQYFTGTLAQTVVLPVVSTLYLGSQYYINNRSTQSITVQSSGTNSIAVIPSNTSAVFTCIATSGTTAASWDFAFDGSQTSGTVTSVLGTSNQITTTGTTVITVALSSTLVTPGTLSINAMTAGSVFFSGASGLVSQKNANFFWDNANNRLGINTNAPGVDLDVIGNGRFSGTLTTASAIVTGTITSTSAVITGTITSANATITSTLTTASAVITGTITAANATVSGTITTVNAVATGTLAVGSGAPFTVTATGVVGISTASTTARLNINATTNCIRAGDDFTADATNPLLSLFGNTVVPIIKIVKSGVMSGYITTSSSGFVFNTDTVNVIDFRTGASTASTAPNTQGTSRLYINTTGVGLQATPTQALEIGGTNAQMYLNSATSNMIQFNTNGVAGPTFTTTRSLGTKLILYPQFANGTSADYAIGINSNTLWYGVPTTTQIHSWFGGITEWMRLNNTGLTIGSTTTTGMLNIGTAAQFQVSSAGAVATSSSLTCGGSLFANSIFTANSANRYNAVFTGTQTPTDGSSNQWTVASIATFAPAAGSTNSFAYYAGPAIAVPISLTAANAGGLHVNLDYTGNAGTITNSYGVYVRAGNATAGTITNAYGGYFTSPSVGISRTALYADSLLLGYATTATAAGTTTLTNTSLAQQFFTGSTTQTVVLPVVSTLFLGHQFFINNRSSGIVTIQSSGLNTITAMPANTSVVVICILTTGTSAASWDFIYNGASTSPVTSIAGTSNQINASASTGAVTLSLSSTIVTPGTLAVNGALTFGTTLTVTGAGSATSMSNLANFTSGGTPTAGNLYSIYIDRTGVEAVALGINKNTTTGSIPANSVFISTYNSAGTISIGRGGNNTLPSTADIFINSTGQVGVGNITTLSAWLQVNGDITVPSGGNIFRTVGSGTLGVGQSYSGILDFGSLIGGTSSGYWGVRGGAALTVPAGTISSYLYGLSVTTGMTASGTGTGTLSTLNGVYVNPTMSSATAADTATITTYRGLYVLDIASSGAGTENVNNKYGVHIGTLAATGTATGNHYGIYVDTVSGATSGNYGIISMSRVGIATATPTAWLDITGNVTAVSGSSQIRTTGSGTFVSGVYTDISATPAYTAISSATWRCLYAAGALTIPASATGVIAVGVSSFGAINLLATGSTATVAAAAGLDIQNSFSAGSTSTLTVTNYYGITLSDPTAGGAGSVVFTSKFGIRVASLSSGSGTNAYGLYINAVSGATNNYGIISLSNMGIGTATPTNWLQIQGDVTTGTGRGMLRIIGSGTFNSTTQATDIFTSSSYTSLASGNYVSVFVNPTLTIPASITHNFFTSVHAQSLLQLTATSSTATVTQANSFMAQMTATAGASSTLNITTWRGVYVLDIAPTGTIVAATKYGIHITSLTSAVGTNQYGIYVDTVSGATNNYGIISMSRVGIATATPVAMLQTGGTIASSTNSLPEQSGVYLNTAVNPTGAVGNTHALYIAPSFSVSGGAITNTYGMRIATFSVGAVTNYGLYVDTPTSATGSSGAANYAAYFGGPTMIGGVTAGAQFCVAGTTTRLTAARIDTITTMSSTSAHAALDITSTYTTIAASAGIYGVNVAIVPTILASTTTSQIACFRAIPVITSAASATTSTLSILYGTFIQPFTSAGSTSLISIGTYYGERILDISVGGLGNTQVTTKYGMRIEALTGTAGATTANIYGLYVDTVSGATTGNYGIISMSRVGIATATPTAMLQTGGTIATSTNTLAAQSGAYFGTAVNPTGAVTNVTALFLAPSFSTAGGSIITSYGLRIQSYSVAANNNYALFVDAPSSATNNYTAFFGGRTGIATTTPAAMLQTGGTIATSTNTNDAQSGTYLATAVNPTGAVSSATTLFVAPSFSVASGSISNAYGIRISTYSVAAGANYGLYVNTPTSGTSNIALYTDNILLGYATTATAAGTTTLTNTSLAQQFFTGTTTQTVVMPVASTLFLGFQFFISNRSTGIVTVQSSGANTITAMPSNTSCVFTCILTSGTTAASWDVSYIGSTTPTSGYTTGSVLFAGSTGAISQKNSNFFWDNTNNRLGIGLSTPTVELDMAGSFKMVGTTANIVTFASSVNQGITYSGLSNSVGVAPCTVGFRFTVGSNSIRVTQLGALQSTGNGVFPSGTRQVAIYDIAGNQLATATADATTPPDNSICYATLATPIILSANTDYIILGFVSANSVGTTFTPVMGSNISFVSYISVTSGSLTFATTNTYLAAFVPYGAVGFKYGLQETTALVTNQSLALNGVLSTSNAVIAGTITTTTATVLGTITTNAAYIASTVIPTSFAALSITYASTLGSSGAVMGRRFTVGSSNLLVTDLGHYQGGFASIFATGTREVAIYDIAGNQLATATVNSATTPENNFRYTAITPIVLLAFTDYIILALEPNGVQVGQGATITYSGITFVSNVSAASNFMIFASGNALGITPTTTGGFKYNSYLTTLSVSNQAVNLNGVMTTTGTLTNSTVVYANNVSSTFTPALGGSLIFAQGLTPTFTTTVTTAITTAGSIYINNTASANAGTITNLAGVFVNAGSAGAGTITNAYGGYFATPAAGISDVALYADSFLLGYATTATAGATTTLTNQSRTNQYFTGSLSQTVVLPVVSTLFLGSQYYINNRSTAGVITVQSSGLNVIATVPSNTSALFTCILTTGTTAASWDFAFDGSQSSTSVASVSGTTNQITTTGTTVITVSLPSTLVAPGTVTATGNLTASSGFVKTSETIITTSALSTTLDSLIDGSISSTYTVTLSAGINDQLKTIKLLNRRVGIITVNCINGGGGTFQLTPTNYMRQLRYNTSYGCWLMEGGQSLTVPCPDSFYPTFQQGLKLTGTGATSGAFGTLLGTSCALSANGNTLVVGGSSDNGAIGATWIFTRTGTTWTQQGTKLIGTGFTGTSQQGKACAISADGNTIAVGGYADNSNIGATWIFTRTGTVWTQQGTKLVGTGNTGNSNQGWSCALSADGNTLAVGGLGDNTNVGAAWIFTRTAGVWTQQGTKLVGTGVTGSAREASSCALSADGNILAIGGNVDNANQGAVWIFTRTGTVWTQQGTKLVGTGNVNTAGQGWSCALSADGSILAVGGFSDNTNQGATWIFTRSGTVWTQQGTKLVGTGNSGSAQQGYSCALTADGNTLAVGANTDNTNQGAAWIFTRSGTVWTQQGPKLIGTGNSGAAQQGVACALSANGNTFVLGGNQDNASFLFGAVWIFT
jgi:hypothetical protein